MMNNNVTISKEWYEDVKAEVVMIDPFFFKECGRDCVEVEVGANFEEVSKEKGWI